MAKQVTLTEIGKRAGVSNVAVGAALGLLSEKTSVRLGKAKAEMIRKVAKEMGYQPNLLARAFRKQETKMIGVLFRVVSNPLSVGYLIDSTHRELLAESYHAYLSPYQSKFDLMWTNVLELLAWRVDGLILMNVFQSDDKEGRWPELEGILADAGMPFVLVGSDIQTDKPQSNVRVDMQEVAFKAANHLLELGHRKLGFVSNIPQLGKAQQAGLDAALKSVSGASIESVQLQPVSHGQRIQSLVLASKATGEVLAKDKNRPTGLICSNDIVAMGIIEGLRKHGLAVPKDVSVIGFDDSDYAVLGEPGLTTFAPPIEQMAKAAVATLLTQIKKSTTKAQEHIFQAELVVRDSTGSVAGLTGSTGSTSSTGSVKSVRRPARRKSQ